MKKQENYRFIEKKKLWKNSSIPTLRILLTVLVMVALCVAGYAQGKELKLDNAEKGEVKRFEFPDEL